MQSIIRLKIVSGVVVEHLKSNDTIFNKILKSNITKYKNVMKIRKEMLTITYTRYVHFKDQKEANDFAKILLDRGYCFAVQKNAIWMRINEYLDKSLEEENEIRMLLSDFTKNKTQ